jgi:hypothetical protein
MSSEIDYLYGLQQVINALERIALALEMIERRN